MAKLIFILSSERSGSTLLQRMLGRNNSIVAPSELWLLRYKDYVTWREKRPMAIHSLIELFSQIGMNRTEEELDTAYSSFCISELYKEILNLLPADRILSDKTPAYAVEMETLMASIPFKPKYVWLIRHPLGVVDSHMRLAKTWPAYRGIRGLYHIFQDKVQAMRNKGMCNHEKTFEARWCLQHMNIMRFMEHVNADQKTVIYFESLLNKPKDNIKALCSFLNITWEPEMLTQFKPKVNIKSGLGDPFFSKHASVDSAPAFAWKKQYGENMLEESTLGLMRHLGYNQSFKVSDG